MARMLTGQCNVKIILQQEVHVFLLLSGFVCSISFAGVTNLQQQHAGCWFACFERSAVQGDQAISEMIGHEQDLGMRDMLVVVTPLSWCAHTIHAVNPHPGGLRQRISQWVQKLQLRTRLLSRCTASWQLVRACAQQAPLYKAGSASYMQPC